jgi:hypothetical protein
MRTLILETETSDPLGESGHCDCAAVKVAAEFVKLCRRRVKLAELSLLADSSLWELSFWDGSGPEFYDNDLVSQAEERSNEFYDDISNNGSAVLPASLTLKRFQPQRVEARQMIVRKTGPENSPRFEIAWKATPKNSNFQVETKAIPLDYLEQVLEEPAPHTQRVGIPRRRRA